MPPAVMTISSLSPLRRLSTWMEAISRAIGAISAIMAGDGQRGHGQEAQRVLALRGHQLELAQRHRDPHHARQGHEDEHKRTGSLPKDVSAEDAHRVPPAPPPALPRSVAPHALGRLTIQGLTGFHSMVAERWPAATP